VTFRPLSSSYFKNFCRNPFFEISPTSGMPRQQTIRLNITLCPTLVCCHLVKQQRRLSQLASPKCKCGCKRIFGIEIPKFSQEIKHFPHYRQDALSTISIRLIFVGLKFHLKLPSNLNFVPWNDLQWQEKPGLVRLYDNNAMHLCPTTCVAGEAVKSILYTDHLYFYKIRRVLVAMWKKTRRSIFPTHFNSCTKHRFQAWCWQWNRPSL